MYNIGLMWLFNSIWLFKNCFRLLIICFICGCAKHTDTEQYNKKITRSKFINTCTWEPRAKCKKKILWTKLFLKPWGKTLFLHIYPPCKKKIKIPSSKILNKIFYSWKMFWNVYPDQWRRNPRLDHFFFFEV